MSGQNMKLRACCDEIWPEGNKTIMLKVIDLVLCVYMCETQNIYEHGIINLTLHNTHNRLGRHYIFLPNMSIH